jgi:hypothetical protein
MLFGLVGPLGGCGVLLFVGSLSGVSQSETIETKKKLINYLFSFIYQQ